MCVCAVFWVSSEDVLVPVGVGVSFDAVQLARARARCSSLDDGKCGPIA